MVKHKKKFNDHPFGYHQEIELEISTLTNLGQGLGRVVLPPATNSKPSTDNSELVQSEPRSGWVVMVPFTLPGERVRARVYRNHKNFSEADLVEVLIASPHRVTPRCAIYGRCGGCQYQHLAYAEQLLWKQRQVQELLKHMAGVEFPVSPVIASPREFGYRSKITPHFNAPKGGANRGESSNRGASSPALTTPEHLKVGLDRWADRSSHGAPGLSSEALAKEDGRALPQNHDQAEASCGELEPKKSNPSTLGSGPSASVPIGFLRQGTRFDIVDVPRCEIATDAINAKLTEVRSQIQTQATAGAFTRGATLLLREASGVVTTDFGAVITETIPTKMVEGRRSKDQGDQATEPRAADLRLRFLARDFFQNNPFILPAFTEYVRAQAAESGARFLVDAYCGSGLFALSAASSFESVAGIEISESSVAFARENAAANGITNVTFQVGDAARIFENLTFPATDTAVVIDPPRKGSDEAFLSQLLAFGPRAVVYVSCDPATQLRDLQHFLRSGYALTKVQPFDLFPQTRHLECVMTLKRAND